jgi:fatty acid/phospholipid biosynthesis enzyme
VIVCDGFVGNIVLKFYESAARLLIGIVQREAPEVLAREDFGRSCASSTTPSTAARRSSGSRV